MTEQNVAVKGGFKVLLWIARVSAVLFVIFILLTLPYLLNPDGPEGPPPTSFPTGWSLIIFPFGVCVAYLIAWFKQLVGGFLALACLLAAWLLPSIPLQPGRWFVVLCLISLLFVLYGWLSRRNNG